MKKLLFAILAISGVALAWAAPPLDRLPELLVPPTEARITTVIVGGSVPPPPARCTCGTQYSECFLASTSAIDMDAVQVGQQFTTGSGDNGKQLCSVEIYISAEYLDASESGTLSVRIDNDTDLTADYLASGTLTFNDGDSVPAWFVIPLSSPLTLSASSTYYLLVDWTETAPASGYGDRLETYWDTGSGSQCSSLSYETCRDTGHSWSATCAFATDSDYYIRLNICN